jgi:hypothetical protein
MSVWTAVEQALRVAEEQAPEGLVVRALAVGLGAAGTPGADALVRLHPGVAGGVETAPATAVADWLEALVARPEVLGGWAFATLTRTEVEAGLRPPVLVLDLDLPGEFQGFSGEVVERSGLETRIRELAASGDSRLGAVDVTKKPHRYDVRPQETDRGHSQASLRAFVVALESTPGVAGVNVLLLLRAEDADGEPRWRWELELLEADGD